MLLTIDVGNTNISCGVIENDKVITTFRATTQIKRTPDELASFFKNSMELRGLSRNDISSVVVSSVVPNINDVLREAILTYTSLEPLFIGPGIKTGIVIQIEDPKSVGADLIVDVVAAYNRYKRACMVVDFGTCTKFLFVNDKAEFQYGIIAPGLENTAATLWGNTAQLPAVAITKPKTVLGKNTVGAMQAGIVYGYIGLTEGLVRQIKKEIGYDFPVIATGGLARYICSETDVFDAYDPNLAYKGMMIINQLNRK
ncbi:MAG: type III pantothenate kinase [Erysipelotrichaceae bacterium]|nr:type III pantothenate kinase [Erysipelotrichaceae bacterium]